MERMNNYAVLKKTLATIPSKKIILFGSQARGTAHADSDYDVLIIIEKQLPQTEKYSIAAKLQKSLAQDNIDADIIIRSELEVEKYKEIRGSLVRNALLDGVVL